MRILVTGSRDWDDEKLLWDALDDLAAKAAGDVVIVHGDCPTGADAMAKRWAKDYGVVDEAHPADWGKYHKGAGPVRNQQMVDLGADICLAFPMPNSRGTRDCARKAHKAGIPMWIYGPHAASLLK